MGTNYPESVDSFSVPSLPANTTLSSSGTSTRTHTQSHQDLGLAVEALETNAAQLTHDHSGNLAVIAVTTATTGMTAQNDIQTVVITGSPTGGTFSLTVGSYGTASGIAYNAVGSAVQTALQTVMGTNNVNVSGNAGGPYTVTFVEEWANTAMPTMSAAPSLTPSGSVNVSHTVIGSGGSTNSQVVSLNGGPTGGTFALSFNGPTTPALAYNASAATVQAALVALSSIGSSNVTVSGSAGGPYTVTFAGSLANAPQSPLGYVNNLTGGQFATQQLLQLNTHQSPDTDSATSALHHTLGPSATQAAPGNHLHDYDGSSIINKPYIRCTSTTRPLDPLPGLMIWETDTNCVRAWANFGEEDILNQGIHYSYGFNTDNSGSTLDPSLFATTYVSGYSPSEGVTYTGTFPAAGSLGAAVSGEAAWTIGANTNARAIARAIVADYATTDTDDQVISFTTGSTTLVTTNDLGQILQDNILSQILDSIFHTPQIISPANDLYLRMSDDETSYVRFTINDMQAAIYYTTNGPANEHFLGSGSATTPASGVTWTAKAIGDAYLFYANDELIVSVVDNANAINVGASFRGWGLGMVAAYSAFDGQLVPNSISNITTADQPYYTSGGIWQLLPVGKVPHVRAESHFRQQIVVGDPGGIVGYDTVLYDWNPYPFFAIETSQTDITIQESGHYSVHAAIVWDGSYNAFDHAMIGITVNGLDIGRKHWEFMRGNGFFPGFNQNQECHFTYYFAAGDILRIQAQHNASTIQWLNYIGTSPNIQTNWVEVDFLGA